MATPCPKPEKRQPKEKKPLKRTELKHSHKPIKKFSATRLREKPIYDRTRKEFLDHPDNQFCPITGTSTTDIHHKKGRSGDLFLDSRYWVALSREGHKYVEENPDWAKENGYSLGRLSK